SFFGSGFLGRRLLRCRLLGRSFFGGGFLGRRLLSCGPLGRGFLCGGLLGHRLLCGRFIGRGLLGGRFLDGSLGLDRGLLHRLRRSRSLLDLFFVLLFVLLSHLLPLPSLPRVR